MATYTDTVFGQAVNLGTTHTNLGTVPASTTWRILFNIVNVSSSVAYVSIYRADTSWSSGEPTGGTLKVRWAYNVPVAVGDVIQLTGLIALTTEKIIVVSSAANSLDVSAQGVAVT